MPWAKENVLQFAEVHIKALRTVRLKVHPQEIPPHVVFFNVDEEGRPSIEMIPCEEILPNYGDRTDLLAVAIRNRAQECKSEFVGFFTEAWCVRNTDGSKPLPTGDLSKVPGREEIMTFLVDGLDNFQMQISCQILEGGNTTEPTTVVVSDTLKTGGRLVNLSGRITTAPPSEYDHAYRER